MISGGSPERTARPEFEQGARRLWEREYDHNQPQLDRHDDDVEAIFSTYAETARTLLTDRGLVLPFQPHQDPTQQDQRTTYVEYLSFECTKLDMIAQKLQKKSPSHAQKYQTAKAEADYQQRRVDWVRSEISKIEAEQKAVGKSGSSSGGTRSGKRKSTDDADGVEPQVGKRRRMDEMEKIVTGRSDNSRMTRSKKRKLPAAEDTPEPQLGTKKVDGESDGSGTRSRKRRKGIHEGNGSAAPGSVLQLGLGAAVVSAVTTHTRPRWQPKRTGSERLGTLRPRVDGKAACVRGLEI